MGLAEVISLSEARASSQWQRLRDDLHLRFDQWLDWLQEQLANPQTSLAEVTEAVWKLRQELTGGSRTWRLRIMFQDLSQAICVV